MTNGLWMDIGKPEEYLETNKIILDSISKNIKQKKAKNFELKHPVAIDRGTTIGEKSIIGPYAILGKNVKVGKNAQITNSVIFEDVTIDDCVSIDGAIIGEAAKIGKNVKICCDCIIADHAKVRDNLELSGKICPGKEVAENVLKPKIHC